MRQASLLFVFTILAGALFAPVHAQDGAKAQRTIRVNGTAKVTAAPDQATVRFGIVSTAETAEAARSTNATASKRAINTVRDLGVPESKIRMETLRLRPRREYNPQTERHEDRGYEATREVVVELSELEQLPRLVTQVVQRGANRLSGIQYGVRDRTSLRNAALQQAATNARDKARLLARSLDASLGPVQEIIEETTGFDEPRPRIEMQYAKAADGDAAPEPDAYAAGEIEVSAQVQVVFALSTE